jgi:glycosidase
MQLGTRFWGRAGSLYPYDIRHDMNNRACCNPLQDGRIQLRLRAEPNLGDVVLVYSDDTVHDRGVPMDPVLAARETSRNHRFVYWEATIDPAGRHLRYSFALKGPNGRPIYFCRRGICHETEPFERWHLDLVGVAPFTTPGWMHGALVYQVFPERFAIGDPGKLTPAHVPWGSAPHWFEHQGGDLTGVTDRLDYLQDLGVEVLYLNPIFTSPSNHKYDTVDYYNVDPALGGNDALRDLVEALHNRGMRIILDVSFNHCHPRFFAFQDVVRQGAASPYCDWFTIHRFPVEIGYRPARLSGYWQGLFADAEEKIGVPVRVLDDTGQDEPAFELPYAAWHGAPNMPKLNQGNPETRRYFLDVAAYWLREYEIDGWRLDVARHVEADFWRDFRRTTKAARPDCYLLAEVWGDTSSWLQGDQLDATMSYSLRDLLVAYLARKTISTAEMVDGLLRLLSRYPPQVTAVTYNLISSHDTERFLTMCDGDITRFKLALLLLLTLPGAPGIYYGDEIGMEGGPEPDCRRAFPWDHPDTWNRDTLEMVRALARLRLTHPALRRGDFYLVWQGEEAFAFLRRLEGQQALVVVNRGPAVERLLLPVKASETRVLWGHGQVTVEREGVVVAGLAGESGLVAAAHDLALQIMTSSRSP